MLFTQLQSYLLVTDVTITPQCLFLYDINFRSVSHYKHYYALRVM